MCDIGHLHRNNFGENIIESTHYKVHKYDAAPIRVVEWQHVDFNNKTISINITQIHFEQK